MNIRPRRNRKSVGVREMLAETELRNSNFIYPLFLLPGKNKLQDISAMPGQSRLSLDLALKQIELGLELGVYSYVLFPCVPKENKNKTADYAYDDQNFYLHSIKEIKKQFPESVVMTDVALDPYSTDGHDGLVRGDEILNDETVEILIKMSLAQAEAGADILGPSDMMDGRVGAIRTALETHGFQKTSIMSYTAKYASAFYGPFRDALDSAPKFGDKKTYQMDPRNKREALLEAKLDQREGADYLMVKPALAYLDIIQSLKRQTQLPVAAYNVSGEYSMIKAAAEKGWLDEKRAALESLVSIKRAGADVILTYWALKAAEWLAE